MGFFKLKLNTDGCSRGNPGTAGFGGVVRDEVGEWVVGYYGRLKDCTGSEAEIWGIFRCLKAVFEQGQSMMNIETDSEVAVKMINDGVAPNSPLRNLVDDCKELLRRINGNLTHTLREGNQVADRLANIGADQEDGKIGRAHV